MSKIRIFRVEDSDTNFVFAADEDDARAVVIETFGLDDGELMASDMDVTELDEAACATIFVDEEDGAVLTLWAEYERNPKRGYVAGTVW